MGLVVAGIALLLGSGALAGARTRVGGWPLVRDRLQGCHSFEAQADAEAYFLEIGADAAGLTRVGSTAGVEAGPKR